MPENGVISPLPDMSSDKSLSERSTGEVGLFLILEDNGPGRLNTASPTAASTREGPGVKGPGLARAPASVSGLDFRPELPSPPELFRLVAERAFASPLAITEIANSPPELSGNSRGSPTSDDDGEGTRTISPAPARPWGSETPGPVHFFSFVAIHIV